MTSVDGQRRDVFRHPGFARIWTAETVSDFGNHITTLALQVLVVLTLHGSATDVGLLNASRWLPYLLLGLVVGALVDRRRRQPILVVETVTATTNGQPLNLRREISEGLRWVYRHRMLAPLAITTHGWFLFNSMLVTVFVPFALLRLQLSASELGVTLAAAGVGGLVGSLVSTRVGLRWGAGRVVIACRALMPFAWAIIAMAPANNAGHSHWIAIVVIGAGQFLYGLAIVVENANELGYRQAVTPDAFQGRMNTTMRSVNRALIVVGAPLGGLLADGRSPVALLGRE